MLIARYRQSWEDRLGYTVKLERWLGAGESIVRVSRLDVAVDTFLTEDIRVVPPHDREFSFVASGGRPGFVIPIRFLVETTENQRLVVELEFSINWPRALPMFPPGGPPPGGGGGSGGGSLDVGEFDQNQNTGNCPVGVP